MMLLGSAQYDAADVLNKPSSSAFSPLWFCLCPACGCRHGKAWHTETDLCIDCRQQKLKTNMMRAKVEVTGVNHVFEGGEELIMRPVTEKPFNEEGASEDNSFARWTPSGEFKMTVNNPALLGRFKPGQKYYADFTPVPADEKGEGDA